MSRLFTLPDTYLLGMGLALVLLAGVLVGCLALRRRWKSTGRKVHLAHAGLGLWLLLLVLYLLEGWTALFYDQTDSHGLANVNRRWEARHVQLNSAGFRDQRPFPVRPSDERTSICFVGDSFTFGHGVRDVADRFSDRIAVRLDREHPGRFSVSNVSRPGLDIRLLVDDVLPDCLDRDANIDVLVYVFVPNDIEYLDERTARHYAAIEQSKPRFFLFADTYFFNLLYFRVQQSRQPELRSYYTYLAESFETEPWQRMQEKLAQLRRLCNREEIDLRIVIFPFLQNLAEDDPFSAAYEQLAADCEANGVGCLDLRAALKPHADEGLVVSRFDAHPNERAHEIAATAIYEGLLADVVEEVKSTEPQQMDRAR